MAQQRRNAFFVPFILPILALLLLAINIQPAYAQDQEDVKLSARVGFGGNCKENTWIPIRVTVENNGPDLDARVEVAYANNSNGEATYGAEISLPTASRKEIFLYIYPQNYLGRLILSLKSGDRVVTSTPLNATCISGQNLLIGLLGNDLTASTLAGALSSNGFARITSLQLADLPDRSQGWESLDALVVSGVDTGGMSDAQRAALKTWLAQGGKLLAAGGPRWQETVGGLGELLPIELNATRTVSDLSALQNYFQSSDLFDGRPAIVAIGKLRPDAEVLVTQDGIPLLAQRVFGFGAIYYLAADPALQPLSDWGGMGNFYGNLLGSRATRSSWLNAVWDSYAANQALSALEALSLPPATSILCLLGVYILVIGPLNYLVLRYFKRQELAWITIPALVILFTLVGYFSGFLVRGVHPILNRLAVVQAWDGVDEAQAHALVGVYSPIRAKYTLNAGEAFLPYPFEEANQGGFQPSHDWLSLEQGEGIVLPDLLVESSGMKATFVSGSLPALQLTHNLVVTIGKQTPTLSGIISNTSQYTLRDVALVTPNNAQNLGDLAPGATKNVVVSLRANPQGSPFYNQTSQFSYYSGGSLQDIRHNALMNAVRSTRQQSGDKVDAGIYLIGWLDKGLISTGLQGQDFESVDTSLYVVTLRPIFTFTPGPLQLTPDLFIWESSDPNFSPYLPEYWQQSASSNGYVLSFKVAVPSLPYHAVQTLTLTLNPSTYRSGPSPSAINVFLWDWENASWVQIHDLAWGNNDIPDPFRYAGTGGTINLRIEQNQNGNAGQPWNELQSSYVTLVVEP